MREEESAKGQQGKQIPWSQFASQLLGLVLGFEAGSTAHSSSLLWEEEKEDPLLLSILPPVPTHLTSPAPRQRAKGSSPAAVSQPSLPPRPCHASPAAAGRGYPYPTFPSLLSWRGVLSQESALQVGTCSLAQEPKAFTFSLFVFILGLPDAEGDVEGDVVREWWLERPWGWWDVGHILLRCSSLC